MSLIETLDAGLLRSISRHGRLSIRPDDESLNNETVVAKMSVVANNILNSHNRTVTYLKNIIKIHKVQNERSELTRTVDRAISVDSATPTAVSAALSDVNEQLKVLTKTITKFGIGTGGAGLGLTGPSERSSDLLSGALGIAGSVATVATVGALYASVEADKKAKDTASNTTVSPTSAINNKASDKTKTQSVQKQYLDLAKKAVTKPIVKPTLSGSLTEQSMSGRFASFLGKTFATVGAYVSAIPQRLGNMASNAASDFAEGFERGPPAGSSEHASQAMNYFVSQGWTKEQAAGIVGNLQQESTAQLNPNALARNDAGPGQDSLGIAQWNKGRLQNLQNFAKDRGTQYNDFNTQLQFVQHELNSTERGAGALLRKARTPAEAAIAIDHSYERSSRQHTPQRIANAEHLAGMKPSAAQRLGSATRVAANSITSAGRNFGQNASSAARYAGAFAGGFTGVVTNVPGTLSNLVRLANSNVNLAVHPTVQQRLKAMAFEYTKLTGRKMQVNSGLRTYAEQAHLWRTMPIGQAARPGNSRHEMGLAVDINSTDGNELDSRGLLTKYGFHRPVRGEAWHLEPVEGARMPRSTPGEETDGRGRPLAVSNKNKPTIVNSSGVKSVPKPSNNPALRLPSNGNKLPAINDNWALEKRTQRSIIIIAPKQPQTGQSGISGALIGQKRSAGKAVKANPALVYQYHLGVK